MHSGGIRWIQAINAHVNVNLSCREEIKRDLKSRTYLEVKFLKDRLAHVFPDEDFCLYQDFPFNQLVIVSQDYDAFIKFRYFTCTFLWLTQYYRKLGDLFGEDLLSNDEVILLTLEWNASQPVCDFAALLSLCKKSNYRV
jgi:hypothetical protein